MSLHSRLDAVVADWRGLRSPPSAAVIAAARHILEFGPSTGPTSITLQAGGGISLYYGDVCFSFDNDDRGLAVCQTPAHKER